MNSPNHLKFGLRLACLLGICPAHLVVPRLRPFYKLYQKTTISYFLAFVATQFVQLYYINLDDFEELLENTGVSLLYVIGAFKTFSCMNMQAIRLIDQIAEVEKEVYREGRLVARCVFAKEEQIRAIIQTKTLSYKIILFIRFKCFSLYVCIPVIRITQN